MKIVDAHSHIVRPDLTGSGPEPLIEAMDASGVERSIVFGLPFPLYDDALAYTSSSDDLAAAAAAAHPDRLFAFCCGFDPRDPASADYLRRRLAEGVFCGVGELLLRYDGRLGELLRQPADDPLLIHIYRTAGEHGVPVMFHCFVPAWREVQRTLAACPQTRFVWAHAGVSWELRVDHSPVVRHLLERFENLHCDLSWYLWDCQLVDPAGGFRPTWIELIDEYPDRFMVGLDLVGEFDEMPAMTARYRLLLAALNEEARPLVAAANAERLLGL